MNPAPIGIFDSGIGGLTVARAIYERLPHESTIYFGDTARVPYGPKSPETVRRYSLEILDWLLGQGVKAVVIACNTSTAHALGRAAGRVAGAGDRRDRARRPRGGGGGDGRAHRRHRYRRHHRERCLRARHPAASRRRPRVEQQACPLFVPLVEEGWFEHPATELIAAEYLEPLQAGAGRTRWCWAAPTIRCSSRCCSG